MKVTKKDYEAMITERNLALKEVIVENPPLQAMIDNKDLKGFVESAHFITVVRPYEKRIMNDTEHDLLSELLHRPDVTGIDRDYLFERTMAIKKNAEIIAQGLDAVDPTIIDTLIRTERLNCVLTHIEAIRGETEQEDEDENVYHKHISSFYNILENN